MMNSEIIDNQLDKNKPMVYVTKISMLFVDKVLDLQITWLHTHVWCKEAFLVHEALYTTSFTFACFSVHWSYGLAMSSHQSALTMFTMGTSY